MVSSAERPEPGALLQQAVLGALGPNRVGNVPAARVFWFWWSSIVPSRRLAVCLAVCFAVCLAVCFALASLL